MTDETTSYPAEPVTEAPVSEPPAASKRARIARLLGAFALGGALLALVIALGGLTLARYDIIEKISGFMAFMTMLFPAGAIAVAAIIALALGFGRSHGARLWQAGVALVLSLGLVLVMVTQVMIPGSRVPPIHDITTNVNNPPQFSMLEVEPLSTGPVTPEEWRAYHTDAYADIQPVLIDLPPVDVLARARVLMEARGWTIAGADASSNRIEATAYAGYLRFKDDVVLEATPVADGSTRVDMRSVSQVGVSDLGYNAERIREFLAALSAG